MGQRCGPARFTALLAVEVPFEGQLWGASCPTSIRFPICPRAKQGSFSTPFLTSGLSAQCSYRLAGQIPAQ